MSVVQCGVQGGYQGAVLEPAPGEINDGKTGHVGRDVREDPSSVLQVELEGLCPLSED